MDRSRWGSLVIAALYVVFSGLGHSRLDEIAGMGMWLAISLGCIWWGDELGEGLVGTTFGLVSSTSPRLGSDADGLGLIGTACRTGLVLQSVRRAGRIREVNGC